MSMPQIRMIDAWKTRLALFLVTAVAVVVLDYFTKVLALTHLSFNEVQPCIPYVLNLRLVMNTGAAFSLGEGFGLLFVILSGLIFVAAFIWSLTDRCSWRFALVSAMVAGAGIANSVDRIIYGAVVDFFDCAFFSFPVFNVADIFISVGIVICLLILFREDTQ